MVEPICKICEHSIFCPTWGDYKCVLHARRFISEMAECGDFMVRGKTFKETKCQCSQCAECRTEDE